MTDISKESSFLKDLAKKSANKGVRLGLRTYEITTQFGQPEATETKQLKTKRIDIYKYHKIGRGFALKITFENGVVAAWEDRR